MGITITRVARTAAAPAPELRAGSARVDITPQLGVGLAGHGPTTNAAQGHAGRLFANLLLLQDATGERYLIVFADLHTGTRYLHERLGADLADLGLTTDRILIAPTHTHRGPASVFGNHSFDRMTGPAWLANWTGHFDQATALSISNRIQAAARSIVGPAARNADLVTLRPAELALTAPLLWGWLVNRSPGALDGMLGPGDPWQFLWTDPAPLSDSQKRALGLRFTGTAPPPWIGTTPTTSTFLPGVLSPPSPRTVDTTRPAETKSDPDLGVVEEDFEELFAGNLLAPVVSLIRGLSGQRRRDVDKATLGAALVDARLHTLVAREAGGGAPIGVFGWLNATPSLVSGKHAVFSSGAFGFAARKMRETLAIPGGIAAGAVGDANLAPRGWTLKQLKKSQRSLDNCRAVVRTVGSALAEALLHGAQGSHNFRADLTLHPSYQEMQASTVDNFAFHSISALAGSDLATSALRLIGEGHRSPRKYGTVQAPKARFGRFEAPPTVFPLRRLELRTPTGPWWSLLGFPLESSAAFASDLAARLGERITVSSLVGDFAGYACTPWEYVSQSYEAGSSYYGMYCAWHVLEAFDAGLTGAATPGDVVLSGAAAVLPRRIGTRASRPNHLTGGLRFFSKTLNKLRQKGVHEIQVTVDAGELLIRGSFDGRLPTNPFWTGPLVTVRSGGATMMLPSGLPLDDVNGEAVLYVKHRAAGTRWFFEVRVPGPVVAQPLSVFVDGSITATGVPSIFS